MHRSTRFLLALAGVFMLAACQTIPGQPATATTPATPSTITLDPKAEAALEAVATTATIAGAAQPGTPWGVILTAVGGIATAIVAGFGAGHSVGNASGVASTTPPVTPAATKT